MQCLNWDDVGIVIDHFAEFGEVDNAFFYILGFKSEGGTVERVRIFQVHFIQPRE